jgi:hypothetical protein
MLRAGRIITVSISILIVLLLPKFPPALWNNSLPNGHRSAFLGRFIDLLLRRPLCCNLLVFSHRRKQ